MRAVDPSWALPGIIPPGFWHGFTWLGDSGLLIPASLLILLALAIAPRTRGTAWLWCVVFGAGSLAILLSKLAFMGWGIGSRSFNFTGFSGHTAISASVWPVVLWLLAARWRRQVRIGAVVFGWLLAAGIGFSRLAVDAHSVSEVVTGYMLGVAVSAVFLALARRRARPDLRWPLVIAGLLLPLLIFPPGMPAPTQNLLERIATTLADIERPYNRRDLHRDSKPRQRVSVTATS
ncbi:phosphatase PAP2 family protein [soil metagenome]